mgnify:CR=1 FL=1
MSKRKEIVKDGKFSDLFAEDMNISKSADQFKTNMSTIEDALDSIESGDFKTSDMYDVIDSLKSPELASATDSIEHFQQALGELQADNLSDFMEDVRDFRDTLSED